MKSLCQKRMSRLLLHMQQQQQLRPVRHPPQRQPVLGLLSQPALRQGVTLPLLQRPAVLHRIELPLLQQPLQDHPEMQRLRVEAARMM